MVAWLARVSIVLVALGAAAVAALAARRLLEGRRARRRHDDERRLAPLALAIVYGDATASPELEPRDARTLAALLTRYARLLAGGGRANVAAFFADSPHVVSELDALRSRRGWRRAAAAFALGDMAVASDAVVYWLVGALGDAERVVRTAAARSLGRLGAADAVVPLVDALAHGLVPRIVAAGALLRVGEPALPALRELLRADDAEVRASAVELVGHLGDAADAAAVAERLRDPAAVVRARAAAALGRLGADDGAAALRAALDDRIAFVREAAATALGAVGDRDAVPALLRAAARDRHEPAAAAAAALARIAPEELRAAAGGGAPHLVEAADRLTA